MVYAIIAGGVFLSDLILKRYMDKKYARKVRHPRLGGRIVLEKYYNEGAALNFMVKKPKLLRIIHTVILVVVGIFSYFLMRLSGHALEKTGVALLLGGVHEPRDVIAGALAGILCGVLGYYVL